MIVITGTCELQKNYNIILLFIFKTHTKEETGKRYFNHVVFIQFVWFEWDIVI